MSAVTIPSSGSGPKFSAPAAGDPSRVTLSNAEKEFAVMERAFPHPCTEAEFDDIYPDPSTRYYKIQRLRKDVPGHGVRLRFVGYIQGARGRPKDAFCNGWYPQALAHEVGLTKALLELIKKGIRIDRGPDVDPKLRPDATIHFPNAEVWHVEWDTGSQTLAQVRNRWAEAYADLDQPETFVLILTRRQNILGLLTEMKPYADFMHIARAKEFTADPFGECLMDVQGNKYAFDKSGILP